MANSDHNQLTSIIIVTSVFWSNFLACGFSSNIGVYYVEFLEQFNYSSGVTSWVGSLNYAVLCLVGPLGSLMCRKWGCPFAITIGGVLSVIGLTVTVFAPNIFVIFIFLGVVSGCGFGITFASGIIVVNLGVNKWRALCSGITQSGSSLGMTLYPFISNLLINSYGWRGATLITAAMTMHICIVAQLIWVAQNMAQGKIAVVFNTSIDVKLTGKEKIYSSLPQSINETSGNDDAELTYDNNATKSVFKTKELDSNLQTTIKNSKENIHNNNNNKKSKNNKTTDLINTDEKSNIWTMPKYWALLLNNILFCFGQSVAFTHIIAYANVAGLHPVQALSFLSIVGIMGIVGRVVLGLAAHHPKLSTDNLFIVVYFTAGISIIFYCQWINYPYMVICMIVLGFSLSGYGPLLTEVIYTTVQSDNFAEAYGFIGCFSAFGMLLGAPCAGWLYDITEQYNNSFYLGGAAFMLSVVPIVLVNYVKKI